MGGERYIRLHVKFEFFKAHYLSNPSQPTELPFFLSINVSLFKGTKVEWDSHTNSFIFKILHLKHLFNKRKA